MDSMMYKAFRRNASDHQGVMQGGSGKPSQLLSRSSWIASNSCEKVYNFPTVSEQYYLPGGTTVSLLDQYR
jgi:hypothetical protein